RTSPRCGCWKKPDYAMPRSDFLGKAIRKIRRHSVVSRFVRQLPDSWLRSCAGHRTREHCALSAMLTVSQLSKSFAGRALFDDVSLQVHRGDRIGLVGPNGAGKSTLFALLLGDVSPDKGTIAIEKNATIGFLP